MKYMGSKRAMLANGLGKLLAEEIPKHNRFIDLFSGSAAVSWHAARHFNIETHAYDLQLYGSVLAGAILNRTTIFDGQRCWEKWKRRAERQFAALAPPDWKATSPKAVMQARAWSADARGTFIQAYGGHYYSPIQASWIEALRATLPQKKSEQAACLAALVMAGSKCAAAPGHTAQPFQPTPTAIHFLHTSWERNLLQDVRTALLTISAEHAQVQGRAAVGNANNVAANLLPNDLVFVDPPYSAVQYSRFYHVLEAIAKGTAPFPTGVGRYPQREDRPTSAYSFKTQSMAAIKDLLGKLATNETTVLLTFPDHECSNGISGEFVRQAAMKDFRVVESTVSSVFSTLGGPAAGDTRRGARRHASELILLLRPR